MAERWKVRYRVPLEQEPGTTMVIAERYREVEVTFITEGAARSFFEKDIQHQPWFDPGTCVVFPVTE